MTFLRAFVRLRWALASLAGGCVLLPVPWVIAAQGTARPDLIDTPSRTLVVAQRSTVSGVASQGGRTIAVGPRGLILLSEDRGVSWRQIVSPVSTDLTTVRFVSSGVVWAVGHDAVALRSSDSGASWERVLDGRAVLTLLRESAKGSEEMEGEIQRTVEQSATPEVWPAPLLDIWFAPDGLTGFAVGGFGLILKTSDAGNTWQPWNWQIDNPQRYHLYALTGGVGGVFVAGEQGLVMHLDATTQRFERVQTPYHGSFFGIASFGSRLLAYGLRGNAFVSEDSGHTWKKIETGTDANLVSAVAHGDSAFLVSQQGNVLAVDFAAARAIIYDQAPGAEVYGAAMTDSHRLALARLNGVGVIAFNAQVK
ncbi:WD40/YVTN/BNR-like repeat-containing protein [Diaphorobacter sp.]|uniref:WD40/YVTN/BNR-like repeat-containing protein n=1 Tax=Diaphorobacter sp. TaxID=1934310 RepID=UPI0028B11713|nr:YCF48-related protein [Diaphorobacter sp.]